jgi:L-ribulokinase
LNHTAADELHAAIEGTAMHTRIVFDRMREGGVPINRVINAGGIPQRNEALNQIYADVLGCEVVIPDGTPAGLGSCIVASVAAGAFETFDDAQAALCLPARVVAPSADRVGRYNHLHELYRDVYFAFGEGRPADLGRVLPELKKLRRAQ